MDKTKAFPTFRDRCELELMLVVAAAQERVQQCHATGDADGLKTAEMDLRFVESTRAHALEILGLLSGQRHSGHSIRAIVSVVSTLVEGDTLTPLTGAYGEWIQTGHKLKDGTMEIGQPDDAALETVPVWQNARCPKVMAEGTPGALGFRAYQLGAILWRDPEGVTYTNGNSSVDITSWPYTPQVNVVDVDGKGNPLVKQGNTEAAAVHWYRTMWAVRRLDALIGIAVDPDQCKRYMDQKAEIYARLDDSVTLTNNVIQAFGVAPVSPDQVMDYTDHHVRAVRLATAIEGECDGLAISAKQADAILKYLDQTGA